MNTTTVKANFTTLKDGVKRLENIISDASAAFQTRNDEKVSATTRRKRQEKSCRDFLATKETFTSLKDAIVKLEHELDKTQREVEASESNRSAAIEREEELTEQLESCNDKLRQVQSARLALENEVNSLHLEVSSLQASNAQFLASTNDKGKDLVSKEEHQGERIQILESENESLRQKLADAIDQLHVLTNAVQELKKNNQDKTESQKHQNEVIAKLTADNLVQMIKLKEQETVLTSYKADLEAMKREVETKKTPWFEEIRSNIELRVKESFETSEELKQTLQRTQKEHETQLIELNVKLEDASKVLRTLESTVLDRETQLNEHKDEITKLMEERTELKKALEGCTRRRNEQEAQLKISAEALATSREECSKLWCQNNELQTTKASLEQSITDAKHQSSNLEEEITEIKRNLEKQIQANKELMKRKEAVEWELVEAKTNTAAL